MPCRFSKFASDQGGNFAIVSAMLAVPVVMAVGTAIDLTTIASTRSDLQQAINSAVLAVAREGKDVSKEKADAIARTFLQGNFDPALTKLSVVKSGTEFSVKADTNAASPSARCLDTRIGRSMRRRRPTSHMPPTRSRWFSIRPAR